MLLRRVLIRLLLLAVCFHTVVGRPVHEATHLLQQRIARVALPAEGAPPSAWPAIDIAAIAFETDAGAGARTGALDGAAIGQGGQGGQSGQSGQSSQSSQRHRRTDTGLEAPRDLLATCDLATLSSPTTPRQLARRACMHLASPAAASAAAPCL